MNHKKVLVAGFTDDPDKFLELGIKARDRGFKGIDCVMPYPVHGFEEAYAMRWSWIGVAALAALFTGWATGYLFQMFMMKWDYPTIIGGKPHDYWPAFVPIIFELGILFAGLTTLKSIIFACKLFPHPCLKVINDRCTDDLFSILIPVDTVDEQRRAEEFLQSEELQDVSTFDPCLMERFQTPIEEHE